MKKDQQQQQFSENISHAIQETLKKFSIQIEMCLTDIPFMNAFCEFLKMEHNSSSLEFVMNVDEFTMRRVIYFPSSSSSSSYNKSVPYSSTVSVVHASSSLSASSSPTSLSPHLKMFKKSAVVAHAKPRSYHSREVLPTIQIDRKVKAKEIIDKFLKDTSPQQVNLSCQMREKIQQSFNVGSEAINPHLFYEARLEMMH